MGNCESCNNQDDRNLEVLSDAGPNYHAENKDLFNHDEIKHQQKIQSQPFISDYDNVYRNTIDSSYDHTNNLGKSTIQIRLHDGTLYDGKVNANNIPNGQGCQKWQNGDTFEGYFVQGKKNGVGKFTKVGSYVYRGNFKENKMTGYGVMVFNDGREYKGEFLNGKFHGQGQLQNKDGKIEQGRYEKGNYMGQN